MLQQPDIQNRTQEAIQKMSPELKSFIHDLFETSVQETIRAGALPETDHQHANPDILSLSRHHKQVCDSADISHLSPTDQKIFKLYKATLSNIIGHRTITALMTNFMVEFVNQLMWITIWYNHTSPPEEKISADIVFNRKGLTPHLAKAILKNVNIVMDDGYQHAIIRDLFRGRYTCNQNNVEILKKLINIIISILTNPESDEHRAFYDWVQNSPKIFGGMRVPKEHLLEFLKFSFDLAFQKDYIKNPKGLYQAWQGTFIISKTPEHYSNLCAKMFEFKFWTFEMQRNSDIGDASHDLYKKELYKFIKEVFSVDVPSGTIEFYAPGLDLNGLIQARDIYSRNVSSSVIPDTSH